MVEARHSEFNELLDSAEIAEREGRFSEAEALCRRVLTLDGNYMPAILRFGVLAARVGDLNVGIKCLSRVLRSNPDCYEAVKWLSVVLRGGIDVGQAAQLSKRAVQMMPNDAEAHNNLGLCFLALHQLSEAERSLRKATALDPTLAIAHHNLGIALRHMGRTADSADAFRAAIRNAPKAPQSYVSLGQLLLSEGRKDEAASCFQEAFDAAAGSFDGLMQLARSLMQDDTLDEAERCIRAVIELKPNMAEPRALLGNILQQRGRFEAAANELKAAIASEPDRASAYFDLAYCYRFTENERGMIGQMETLLQRPALPAVDRRHLNYALGKAHDDLGEYELAMKHFDEANRVVREQLGLRPMERERYAKQFAEIAERFTPEFFRRNARFGSDSELPVLVVGMIRSGTTLVEQILSSHPQIEGAGELRYLIEKGWGLLGPSGEVIPAVAEELKSGYLRLLQSFGPKATRVVDKMPNNFVILGTFLTLFPKGRVIECRRNPVDTCLSIYTTPFREVINFAHYQENIVFAYRQYANLMDHWRKVIPSDRILTIDYEDLVADRETVTRRMIEFSGVPWDDVCLHHELNTRPVNTPSQWQARQPIYNRSVERWRRYEPWLGGLKELIGS